MLERKEALQLILKNCSEKFEQLGFTSAPVCENGDEAYVDFTKDDITIRLLSHDNLLDVTEKAGEGDFVKVESNLLDLEAYEERDIKSLSNEIIETVSSSYGKKARQAAKKAPQTISKTAAKMVLNTMQTLLQAVFQHFTLNLRMLTRKISRLMMNFLVKISL